MSNRYCNSQVTSLSSTAETAIVAADPNTENLLVSLIISCTTALAGTITVRDVLGAPVAKLIFDFPSTAVAPTAPFWVQFDPPLKQSTKNSAWTIQQSAANTIKVNAQWNTEE